MEKLTEGKHANKDTIGSLFMTTEETGRTGKYNGSLVLKNAEEVLGLLHMLEGYRRTLDDTVQLNQELARKLKSNSKWVARNCRLVISLKSLASSSTNRDKGRRKKAKRKKKSVKHQKQMSDSYFVTKAKKKTSTKSSKSSRKESKARRESRVGRKPQKFQSFKVLAAKAHEPMFATELANNLTRNKRSLFHTEMLGVSFNPGQSNGRQFVKSSENATGSDEAVKSKKSKAPNSKATKDIKNLNVFFNTSSNTGNNTESLQTSITVDKSGPNTLREREHAHLVIDSGKRHPETFTIKKPVPVRPGTKPQPISYQHSFGNNKMGFEESTANAKVGSGKSVEVKADRQSKIIKSKSQDVLRNSLKMKLNHSNSSNLVLCPKGGRSANRDPGRPAPKAQKNGYYEMFQKKKTRERKSSTARKSQGKGASPRVQRMGSKSGLSEKEDRVGLNDYNSVLNVWTNENIPEEDLMDSDLDLENDFEDEPNNEMFIQSSPLGWKQSTISNNRLEDRSHPGKWANGTWGPTRLHKRRNDGTSKSLSLKNSRKVTSEKARVNGKIVKKIDFPKREKLKIKPISIPKSRREVKHLAHIDITHKRHRRVHQHKKSQIFW